MADSVDAWVFRQQRSLSHAPLDASRRDARAQQLRPRHHAVLSTGDPVEFLFHRGIQRSHTDL
jgi:hypothetical protein